jgi:5-methylcytosine-specific restriction endonuclease McrA
LTEEAFYGSRQEARDAGAKFYCTGEPCKRGHATKRRTSTAVCVECATAYLKSYISANREHVAALARENYAKNRSQRNATRRAWNARNKDKRNAAQRRWNEKNPDKVAAARRRYHAKNPSLAKEWAKAWKTRNPSKAAAMFANNQAKRRARKATCEPISAAQIAAHKKRYGKHCAICRDKGKTTLDHIIPLSAGGAHRLSNIQWLCFSCNSSKGARSMEDFARAKGLLI